MTFTLLHKYTSNNDKKCVITSPLSKCDCVAKLPDTMIASLLSSSISLKFLSTHLLPMPMEFVYYRQQDAVVLWTNKSFCIF